MRWKQLALTMLVALLAAAVSQPIFAGGRIEALRAHRAAVADLFRALGG